MTPKAPQPNKRLSSSVRAFIRREKARIRKNAATPDEAREKIRALSERLHGAERRRS